MPQNQRGYNTQITKQINTSLLTKENKTNLQKSTKVKIRLNS